MYGPIHFMWRRELLFAGAVAIIAGIIASRPVASQDKYILGVFPVLPPAALFDAYGHFGAIMSIALGRKVEFETGSNFKAFRAALEKQRYDIALMQPFDYIDAAERYSYVPLVRWKGALRANFAVPSTSEIVGLQDLAGKRLATPPSTAAVRYLAFEELMKAGLRPGVNVELLSLPSHPACLQSVLIGDAEACVTAPSPLKLFQAGGATPFRVIAKSSPIPHATFVTHSRVSDGDRKTLREALLALDKTEEGRAFLRRLGWPNGLIAATDAEYDVVRALAKKYRSK